MYKKIVFLFLGFITLGFSQNSLISSGPMVGYCEFKEAAIWLQTNKNESVKVEYFAIDNSKEIFSSETYNSCKENGFTYHIILDQLQPGKKYNYTVFINNKKVTSFNFLIEDNMLISLDKKIRLFV